MICIVHRIEKFVKEFKIIIMQKISAFLSVLCVFGIV